jgi:hypothetical protein
MKKKVPINTIKVMGLHIHENTLVKFTSTGMSISTGVNVTSDIAFILTYHNLGFTGKVFKGTKMQIYKKARHILSRYVCENTVINIQKQLLLETQADVALAKSLKK